MNIALTGANGSIGKELIPFLIGLGHNVYRISSSIPSDGEFYFSYKELIARSINVKIDVFFHLASINSNLAEEEINDEVNLTRDMLLSLEIDPNNENIIYFSGGGTLYKSSNGGSSFTNIGSGEFNSGIEIKEIMIHNGKLWVASNQGLYYSSNSGNSFSQKMSGIWLEMEVHPSNSQVIYAVKENTSTTSFYKSTNNFAFSS